MGQSKEKRCHMVKLSSIFHWPELQILPCNFAQRREEMSPCPYPQGPSFHRPPTGGPRSAANIKLAGTYNEPCTLPWHKRVWKKTPTPWICSWVCLFGKQLTSVEFFSFDMDARSLNVPTLCKQHSCTNYHSVWWLVQLFFFSGETRNTQWLFWETRKNWRNILST